MCWLIIRRSLHSLSLSLKIFAYVSKIVQKRARSGKDVWQEVLIFLRNNKNDLLLSQIIIQNIALDSPLTRCSCPYLYQFSQMFSLCRMYILL